MVAQPERFAQGKPTNPTYNEHILKKAFAFSRDHNRKKSPVPVLRKFSSEQLQSPSRNLQQPNQKRDNCSEPAKMSVI